MNVTPGVPKAFVAVLTLSTDEAEVFDSGRALLNFQTVLDDGSSVAPVWDMVENHTQPIEVTMPVEIAEKLGITDVDDLVSWVGNRVQETLNAARA